MGFWNKLGKIALTAAPYVAAPFTGGMSLMATGAANKAVQKWSESDAKKAAAKGLAPSKFDDILGKVGGYAALGSSFIPTNALGSIGMLGKAGSAGSKAASSISKLGGWQGALAKTGINTASQMSGGGNPAGLMNYAAQQEGEGDNMPPSTQNKSRFIDKLGGYKGIAGIASGIGGAYAAKKLYDKYSGDEVPQAESYGPGPEPRDMGTSRFQRRMGRELGPVMGQANQNNPNLALSIGQGRMDAMRDQPFRGGYDVRTVTGYDDEDNPQFEYTPMPRIGPDYNQPRRDRYYGGGGNPEMSGFKRRLGGGRGRRYQQEEATA